MNRSFLFPFLFLLITLLVVLTGSAVAGSKYQVIHRLQQTGNGGTSPTTLIADPAGNLYGTTDSGGKYDYGTVYELKAPAAKGGPWTTIPLYSFPNGFIPVQSAGAGWLILDQSGNLYGVTAYGGHGCDGVGCGTVFKLTPTNGPGSGWTETNLYVFSGWDGFQPGGLAVDQEGNLYGTTYGGGRGCRAFGCGTVFKLTPSAQGKPWKRTVIYYFKGVPGDDGDGDGAGPYDIVFDAKGNLYGATLDGGHCVQGTCNGTAFELKPPAKNGSLWTETVLYRFSFSNSDQLYSGLVLDKSGAIYGSTQATVYQLVLENGVWTENVLVSDAYVYSGVVLDGAGNLYGTALFNSQYQNGWAFELSPPEKRGGTWTQTVLHVFASDNDGAAPSSGVTFGLDGLLYGTTLRGGNNQCVVGGGTGCGTVFRLAP
jgi:uncharacterized repeat protein (TIGR03803 family)